jgi:hypothetical protein
MVPSSSVLFFYIWLTRKVKTVPPPAPVRPMQPFIMRHPFPNTPLTCAFSCGIILRAVQLCGFPHRASKILKHASKLSLLLYSLTLCIRLHYEQPVPGIPAIQEVEVTAQIMPEGLILDQDNIPKVSTQLVQTKPLILGAKLKYISHLLNL